MKSSPRSLVQLGLAVGSMLALSVNCQPPPQLHKFADCEEFELFLKDQVMHPAVQTSGGGWGSFMSCGNQAMYAEDKGASPQSEGSAAPTSAGDNGRATSYTTTNTQEVNVDEADFVKNDGEHIFVLRRGHLTILDAWPADQTRVVSDVLIDADANADGFIGNPFSMFFDGTHLMVVGTAGGRWTPVRTVNGSQWWGGGGGVVVSLFDVSDPGAPLLLRRVRIDGSFLDARRVGDQVALVTSSWLAWPDVNEAPFSDDENRRKLDAFGLDNMLPGIEDQIIGVDSAPRRGRACACDNAYAPDETDGRSLVLVHALSMTDPAADIRSTTVVTSSPTVYGSEDAIYLASSEWKDGGYFTPTYAQTRIHKFSAFQGNGAAEYQATGVVEGAIHNQFSMDELGNDFRIVVTNDQEGSSTSLLVLQQEGDALVEVGRVDEIGKGEFVQAVRFLGDKAYIVTYPQPWGSNVIPPGFPCGCWDPLFVVDLSDPHNPRLRGQLEVDGYSTYIHPLDDNHVLTIGVNTDQSNVIQGLSLSIFDVANPDLPALEHRIHFGDGWSFSAALSDHHAFTYFPEQKTLAIPLQLADWSTSGWWGGLQASGLEVFHVDPATGFTHLGRIDQTPMYSGQAVDINSANCIDVRRSVMMADEQGAYVYAVSTGGISVARIEQGLPAIAEVRFLTSSDPFCPVQDLPL